MKRFTSREKYEDRWYRQLSPTHKCLWDWLFTHCDNAGTIDPDIDFEQVSLQIGEEITADDLVVFTDDRIVPLACGRIWLRKFIEFQYGILTETCHPHRAVVALCEKYGLPIKTKEMLQQEPKENTPKIVPVLEPKKPKAVARQSNIEQFSQEIKKVIDYFNLKAETSYKSSSKAATKFISGRLSEGYTFDDLKKVIDNKVKAWGHDPKMAQYLRPITLFAPEKFESYVNEKASTQMSGSQALDDLYGAEDI